jgi:hypothetical protein
VKARGIPVSISFPLTDPSWWGWDGGAHPVAPYCDLTDFLDFHVYTNSTPAQVASTYQLPWAKDASGNQKPMIFGEFGACGNMTTSTGTATYARVQSLVVATNASAGALAWTAWDLDSTGDGQCGLFASPGQVRQPIATTFSTFPETR